MRFSWIRKTGAAVHGLPIGLGEQDEGEAIQLPCPATDLIRLATVVTDRNPTAEIHRLLRLNPSLLLFALAGYRLDRPLPPDSASELVAWCQPNLFYAIGRIEISNLPGFNKSCSRKTLNSNFEDFFRARNNKKLRRSLRRFLGNACGVDKSTSKNIVTTLVGRKLRAEQLKCRQVRRQKTREQVTRQWLVPPDREFDVAGLLELAGSKCETAARFADRLQEEKLASMKQLAYGASHEINNPLANIATRAQTMLSTETDHEKRHKLAVIYEQAMRAHEMISDMMLFAHPPALNPVRVSVRLLMSRIVHELKPALENNPGIELKLVIGTGIDQAQLDPTQFTVAIKNLVQNSMEALRSSDERNPKIEIRIDGTESGEFRISVWDNGQGISDEAARHLFDPFFSGREAGRGLGFGLAKVWTIAKLHGGKVHYDPDVEVGTQFILTLPGISDQGRDLSAATKLTICHERSNVEEEAA